MIGINVPDIGFSCIEGLRFSLINIESRHGEVGLCKLNEEGQSNVPESHDAHSCFMCCNSLENFCLHSFQIPLLNVALGQTPSPSIMQAFFVTPHIKAT